MSRDSAETNNDHAGSNPDHVPGWSDSLPLAAPPVYV